MRIISSDYKILRKQVNRIFSGATVAANRAGSEVCGLLISNDYFIELVQIQNKNKSGGGYSFYANEVRFIQKSVLQMRHEIVGTFHSHPNYIAEPSESDIRNAVDDSLMLIIDVMGKKIGLWHIHNGKKRKIKFQLIG